MTTLSDTGTPIYTCTECGASIIIPLKCEFCGNIYCNDHINPTDHKCTPKITPNEDDDIKDQDQLANDLMNLFELVVRNRKSYYEQNPGSIPNKGDVKTIISNYSEKCAIISGGSSLVPGPLGLLAILPELYLVITHQISMIYDIGMAYRQEKWLTKEILANVFLLALGGGGGIALITIHGGRVFIKRASLRFFQKIITYLGGRITQQVLKSAVSKWLPVVGAGAMAVWSYYTTQKIGSFAKSIFEKDISLDTGSD